MKKILIFMFTLCLTLSMFGCSKTDNKGIDVSGNEEKVKLQFYTWWSGGEKDLGEALIKEYESINKNVEIVQNYIPYGEYHTKLNAMIVANETPDIYFINEYLVNEWGEKGIAEDLNPYFEKSGIVPEDTYFDTAIFETEKGLWGVSFSLGTYTLYYNKDMFREAGIDFPTTSASNPWTWEEYIDAARKLTVDSKGNTPNDDGFDANSVRTYGTVMPTNMNYITALLTTNNGSFVSMDGQSLGITKPESIEVIQKIADLSHVEKIAPSYEVQLGSFSDMPVMLMNGQLGMFIDGTWMLPNFQNEGFEVGLAQIPMISKANNAVWGSAFQMSRDSKHKDEAFEFYKFLSDYNNAVDVASKYGVSIGNLPNTISTVEDADMNKKWKENFNEDMATVTGNILNDASVIGECTYIKNYASIVEESIMPNLEKVWLGELNASEAVAGLDDELQSKLQGAWE